MCLSHPWRGVQERFLIELLELNTINEHFSYEFLMRKKYIFVWKTTFDKVLKLAEGVIKPLQCKEILKVLKKFQKSSSERIH